MRSKPVARPDVRTYGSLAARLGYGGYRSLLAAPLIWAITALLWLQQSAQADGPGMRHDGDASRSTGAVAKTKEVALHIKDRRIPVDHAKGSKFSPLGIIVNSTVKGRFTAFLVGECHVLTTAHSVIGTSEMNYISPDSKETDYRQKLAALKMEFLVGQTSTTPFAESTRATVEIMGKYDPGQENHEEDWALLKLDDCLGATGRYGHYSLLSAELSQVLGRAGFFHTAGFPGDRDLKKGAWLDPECSVRGKAPDAPTNSLWASDCNLMPGQSGSPALATAPNGKTYVLGLAVSQISLSGGILSSYRPGNANIILSVKGILPIIKAYIQTDQAVQK